MKCQEMIKKISLNQKNDIEICLQKYTQKKSIRIYLIISLYNIALNNDYTEDENINLFNPKKIIHYYQEVNTKIKK